MATYDPKARRPGRVDRSEGSEAPVDEIVDLTAERSPTMLRVDPSPVEVVPGPDRLTQRIAVVSGVAAATVAAFLVIRRLRRR